METIDNMFSRWLPMVYISYQQVLNRDLLRSMRIKRAPLLPTMLFHHDNAPRASTTQDGPLECLVILLTALIWPPVISSCSLHWRRFCEADNLTMLQICKGRCSPWSLPLDHPHTRTVSIHGLKVVESAFHSKGSTLKSINALRQKLRKGMWNKKYL